MSFRDLIDTASAIALADVLNPSEVSVWERYCREFSTKFATPLMEVRGFDPLFVIKEVNADNLSDFRAEERLPDMFDMLGSLSDTNYDINKERAIREEMKQIQEREEERLREGRAIHPILEKDKRVIAKDQPPKKELPKSGGLNMDALRRLNNQDNEG